MRWLGSAVVAVMWLGATVPASADWIESFDNGQFQQAWSFGDELGGLAAVLPGQASASGNTAFSAVATGDFLGINSTGGIPGIPPTTAMGWVAASFADVRVAGQVNVSNTLGSNNQLGVIARGNLNARSAYVLFYDIFRRNVYMSKVVNGAVVGSPFDDPIALSASVTNPYLELEVSGNDSVTLIGRIYDSPSKTTLLGTLNGADAHNPLLTGVSGCMATVNAHAGPDITKLGATFDNLSSFALGVPEPASLTLLVVGGLGVGFIACRRPAGCTRHKHRG